MDDSVIRSRTNAALKRVRKVHAGKEPGLLVLEGIRLVRDAVASGLVLSEVFVAEERTEWMEEFEGARLVEADALRGVSELTTTAGILALAREPDPVRLAGLRLDERSRLLIVDGIADPGNLGALVRAAEALGVAGVGIVRGGARPWSSKALRGSMGSLLRLPVQVFDSAEQAASELSVCRNVVARTRGGRSCDELDWRGPLAIWVGSEAGTASAVSESFEGVTIPMAGRAESLNVTVAAALLLDAARRGAGS